MLCPSGVTIYKGEFSLELAGNEIGLSPSKLEFGETPRKVSDLITALEQIVVIL